MLPTQKPDYAKIVFTGIPLLFIFWVVTFALLAYLTRDINISKYGALLLFLFAIPGYWFLAIKNATLLGAVLHENEEDIRKGLITPKGKKKYPTNVELWLTLIAIILMFTSAFICEVFLGISSEKISKFLIILVPVAVLIEIAIRKLIHNKQRTKNK